MKARQLVGIATLVGMMSVGVSSAVLAVQPHRAAAHSVAAAAIAPLRVNLTVVTDAVRGSDKRHHDAVLPANIVAVAGQKVIVTVYSLDQSPHSFTAPALGLNVVIRGAPADGVVGITTFSFTVTKTGRFHWKCLMPCDNGGPSAWAMQHDGFMAGNVIVLAH